MDWVSWVIVLHVLSAVAWVGAAIFMATFLGPTLAAAGPAAGGFLTAVEKRGGFSRFFLPVGAVAILAGGVLYGKEKVMDAAWSGGNLWLSLAAILAVLAYLDGVFLIHPVERKLKAILLGLKGPPTKEQGDEIMGLGKKIGMMSAASALLVTLALVGMLVRRLV